VERKEGKRLHMQSGIPERRRRSGNFTQDFPNPLQPFSRLYLRGPSNVIYGKILKKHI
jgi:hypothetical protein